MRLPPTVNRLPLVALLVFECSAVGWAETVIAKVLWLSQTSLN